jgi:hypothetical protein
VAGFSPTHILSKFIQFTLMSSTPTSKKNGFFHKKWVQVCGGGLIALPLLFMLSLYGVKSYLVDWFQQNGADSAGIEKLVFNPFLGRLTLEGLDVQVGGQSLLKNAEMVVDVGFTALFNKNIKVQRALYSGLVLDLEQFADGSMRIGSYTLEKSGDETVAETAEETVSSWAFLADEVDLADCVVKLKTPDLDLELLVEKAELRKFTTREGQAGATLLFVGSLDGERVEIELSSLQITPSLHIEGEVKVSRFQLTEIASFLKEALPVFAGDVGLDGHISFIMGDQETMVINYEGDIEVIQPDIGFDSFATQAANLKWQGSVQYESGKDKPMIIVTDGLLAAEEYSVEVAGADFKTEESNIELKGRNTVTITDNVVVENDGTLLMEQVAVHLPGNEITEERLHWEGSVIYDSNHSGAGQYVATKGVFELAPLVLILGEDDAKTSVHSADLSWKGDIVYGQEEGGENSYVQLVGNLDGHEIATALSGPGMTIEQGSVTLTTDSKLTFGETVDIKGTNSLVLDRFVFAGGAEGPKVTLEKLEILDLEGVGGKDLRLKQLSSAGLFVALDGSFPMDIAVPVIQFNGFSTKDLANFNIESIALENPQIVASHNGEELLRMDEIKATTLHLDESIHVTAESISIAALTFLGVKDGAKEPPFLTLGEAKLSGIKWQGENGFTGESLLFDDLITTAIRDKTGELNVSRSLSAMQVATTTAGEVPGEVVAESGKEEKALPIRLGEVAVTGKSHVKFEDYTLAVPYLTDLAIKKMQLLDLDSTRPEVKSPFVLDAELEERAPFTVEGDISPFMAPIALHLKLKLKNYPLSRLSAYTVQSVGTGLESGQLKLKTKLNLENDNLDMENSVILKKLETETISPELAAELNNQLPIPLDAALSILRDSDRNISLDIPLSGLVSDLNVGISDVLITALSKAIIPAASGYLMYTLGPYGALAYVGMKVGEKMLKVELPPVDFVPGEIDISDEHKKYLEKVAEVLEGRPETDIQLCPQVVSWEFMDAKAIGGVEGKLIEVAEEEREKLTEIGQVRAKAIQTYLGATYGVDLSRLLICDTLIETGKGEKPLVMLNL